MNAKSRSVHRRLYFSKIVSLLIGGAVFATVLNFAVIGRPEVLSFSDAAIFILVVSLQMLPFVVLAGLSTRTGWAVLLSVAIATAAMLAVIDVAIARCALRDPICGVYYLLSPFVVGGLVAVVTLLLSAAAARIGTRVR